MRILLTNISLCDGSGTETLIRDLSLALRRRGHAVICFAPAIGRMAAEIRATGTPVVQSLAAVAESPDIIHGHHSGPTMMALTRFRNAPAVFVCHDWSSVYDDPPCHPRIGRYLYVRHVLRERLVSEKGIPPERVRFWGNTIDLTRVDEPKALPSRPRTAGVYGHAGRIPFLPLLAAACAAQGIEFLGELLRPDGDRHHVEAALLGCDLVFASGRMAIEAIAAGCAVINADRFGIGGLVTSARMDEFLAANFAIGALSEPASEPAITQALDGYDTVDAAAVTARIRQDCDIAAGAERLEAIYREILREAAAGSIDRAIEDVALARYLEESLQHGRLYQGEFARRISTPTSGDELHATVRKLEIKIEQLSRAIDELSLQARDLSRSRIGSFLMFVLRAMRARWTRRWLMPVRFQGDPKGRNASGPSHPGAVPGTQDAEGAASAPTRPQ
jgi:hypothetical protein